MSDKKGDATKAGTPQSGIQASPGSKLRAESTYGREKHNAVSTYGKAKTDQVHSNPKQEFSRETIGPAFKEFEKDGYSVLDYLGDGAYAKAKVYKVQTKKGRTSAVKVIDLEKASENYRVKFMPRELQILMKVRDDHIVGIHEIKKIRDRAIMIYMEFAPGGTVASLLRQGPVSEARAVAFSFTSDTSANIHLMRKRDGGGDTGVINCKTPTTLLLTPHCDFHSFGFGSQAHYHNLDDKEANK